MAKSGSVRSSGSTEDNAPKHSHYGRRRFLAGVGGGGLATAAAVFGFTPSASASSNLTAAGCCDLCCSPSHNMAQCETGSYYVWSCSQDGGYLYCDCCEHAGACGKCNSTNYSSYSCQYG